MKIGKNEKACSCWSECDEQSARFPAENCKHPTLDFHQHLSSSESFGRSINHLSKFDINEIQAKS